MKTCTAILLSLFCTANLGAAPINVRTLPGTTTDTETILFWEKPSDYQQITKYTITLNGKPAGSTDKNFFKLTSLTPARDYTVVITARRGSRDHVSKAIHLKTKPSGKSFNVKDFGAKGDGKTLDTESIQAAIDACTPYGEVIIPAGEYITGALFLLKDDISIDLQPGAVLRAVHDPDAFPLVKTRYEGREKEAYASVLNIGAIGEKRHKNIRIHGGGTIDNQGSVLADRQTEIHGRMARSHGLPVINCDDVAIDGITVRNPCTWNVHPIYCSGFTTYGCTMLSDKMGLSNADGWDPDSSRECYLVNSVLECHDDHIAIKSGSDQEGRAVGIPSENIHVSHCLLRHGGGIAIGSEMSGGVKNVRFEDLRIENSDRGFHVKSRPGRGGIVEDVLFRDITVEKSGGWGISVDMWYYVENHIYGSRDPEEIPVIRNIAFENIRIQKTQGNPIQIIGLKESPISDISFRNVTIAQSEFKVLLRNCKNIRFENVDVGSKYWIEDNAENIVADERTSRPKELKFDIPMVDKDATYATKALYANLIEIGKSGRFLFGQQDATNSGYGWKDDSGRCDIEMLTGRMPAFYSWDIMDFTRYEGDNAPSEARDRRNTCRAFYLAGVNSYCWHYWNPVTKGSFYDTTVRVVKELLPGGTHHEVFKEHLKRIADYNATLIGKYGEQIPIIFRPWHEFDGKWFWWGAPHCTPEEFKALYRFTVTYLRDVLKVRNFIYAFSPDCKFASREEYLERYPGDEYVDIIAMDNYNDFRFGKENIDNAHMRFKIISDYAAETGKAAAVTETGQSKIENPQWFTQSLMKAIYGYKDTISLAYVAVWRNSMKGFYTPYKGHPAEPDFMKFIEDPRVILGDKNELRKLYELK